MKEIKVLWTGGWDSTFRIVELSRQKVIIQPIYVLDSQRKSIEYEFKAMDEIVKILEKKRETIAQIKPLKVIKKEDIPKNDDITNAYKVINSKTKLGSQHDWLARLAVVYPNIEIGTEWGEPETSHIIQAIQDFGELVIEDGIGYLDKEKSSKEGRLVLGNFNYPIINKTEKDMLEIIKEIKYEDVMKHIWFCHKPINGEPCGICHPCNVKIESDMSFLLPNSAIKRYKKYIIIKNVLGEKVANKISEKIIKIKNLNKENKNEK